MIISFHNEDKNIIVHDQHQQHPHEQKHQEKGGDMNNIAKVYRGELFFAEIWFRNFV